MPTPAPLPKVLYISDSYISHATAAGGYRQALEALGCLTKDPQAAQVVVVHTEMGRLSHVRGRLPALQGKYTVGMLVWEVDRVPTAAVPAVRAVDEVWTPTLYSARALVCEHRRVFALPHVVEAPVAATTAAHQQVEQWLGVQAPGAFEALATMPLRDPRKNFRALLTAARNLRARAPSFRLIVKAPLNAKAKAAPFEVRQGPNYVILAGQVPKDVMRALLERVHCAVSAHRAEGWGLGLSDALARGVLVVASGFSGNLSFMHKGNSLLVDCDEHAVGVRPQPIVFPPNARWAQPRQLSLEAQLLRAQELHCSGAGEALQRQGRRDVARYSSRRLQYLLAARLRAIAASPSFARLQTPGA